MAAPNDFFVKGDGDDGGAGTLLDPWQTIPGAISNITQDAANGDRLNVHNGFTYTLTSPLNIAVNYGSPSRSAPFILRGYANTANDLTWGSTRPFISGGGTTALIDESTLDGLYLQDLKLGNTGANAIITIDDNYAVVRCELTDTDAGVDGLVLGTAGFVIGNYFHDIGGNMCQHVDDAWIHQNFFRNDGAVDAADCITKTGTGMSTISFNKADIGNAATRGIDVGGAGRATVIAYNSGLAVTGTGHFIHAQSSGGLMAVLANAAEGFNGVSGQGLETSAVGWIGITGGNYGRNAPFNNVADIFLDLGGDTDAVVTAILEATTLKGVAGSPIERATPIRQWGN